MRVMRAWRYRLPKALQLGKNALEPFKQVFHPFLNLFIASPEGYAGAPLSDIKADNSISIYTTCTLQHLEASDKKHMDRMTFRRTRDTQTHPGNIGLIYMNSKEERISIRFGEREVLRMDEFVEEDPKLDNRSELIRIAVNEYMARNRTLRCAEDEVSILIKKDFAETLDNLVEKKQYHSLEAAIFEIIRNHINEIDWNSVDSVQERMQRAKFENSEMRLSKENTEKMLRN